MQNKSADDLFVDYMVTLKSSVAVKTVYSVNVLLDVIGLLAFSALTLTTIKHKKLHTRCHLLIGLYSICFMGTKLIIFPSYLLLINPWLDTVPILLCSLVQLVPLSATYNIYTMMLAIGFDRMLSVCFPLWYALRSDKLYLSLVYCLSALFPLFVGFAILSTGFSHPSKPSTCTMFELLGQFTGTIMYLNFALISMTILCYLVILVKLLFNRHSNGSQNATNRQPIIKSLLIIMSIQIGGSLLGYFGFYLVILISHGSTDPLEQYVLGIGVSCFISISSTAEVPCLYFTSSDHRTALRKELHWLFRLFSKTTGTNSASDVVITGVNLRRQSNRIDILAAAPEPSRPSVHPTSWI